MNSRDAASRRGNSRRTLVPYSMAICQFALEEVPQSSIIAVRDVNVFESERGEGKLGSSGK